MSCDRVRTRLMEMVYGELDDARRRAVEQHIESCAACREELARLRAARAALATARAGEPSGMALPVPVRTRPARWTRGLLPGGAGLAAAILVAAILLGALLWVTHDAGVETAAAADVEIRRIGVSLTVVSTPADWPKAGQRVREGRRTFRYDGWPGLALVRDRRLVRHLPVGRTRVRFTDVPARILPDTVRLHSVENPGALTILEQNYAYDLASASSVLARHVDRNIAVAFKDGVTATGNLLSFDNASITIRADGAELGAGPRMLARRDIRTVSLAKLPRGLLTRPTLVWELENRAPAMRQRFEVAYLTHGLKWRADYVLKLRPGGGKEARGERAGGEEAGDDTLDAADLVGYATVTNDSGVTFKEARLKLIAGDVNLIRPELVRLTERNIWRGRLRALGYAQGPQFQEKSFFEYHLYTLGRTTTIRSAETKQIELVSGAGIRLKRAYVYDPQDDVGAARVVSEFRNSRENGLGNPLPRGVVRLYAPDPTGADTYVAQTTIDHTPVNEKIRLRWGHAFDITCRHWTLGERHEGDERIREERYTIRNHKDRAVTVTAVTHVPATTHGAECNYPWHVREVGRVEIDVPVEANAQADVTWTIHYNVRSGGGLKSPHDDHAE